MSLINQLLDNVSKSSVLVFVNIVIIKVIIVIKINITTILLHISTIIIFIITNIFEKEQFTVLMR